MAQANQTSTTDNKSWWITRKFQQARDYLTSGKTGANIILLLLVVGLVGGSFYAGKKVQENTQVADAGNLFQLRAEAYAAAEELDSFEMDGNGVNDAIRNVKAIAAYQKIQNFFAEANRVYGPDIRRAQAEGVKITLAEVCGLNLRTPSTAEAILDEQFKAYEATLASATVPMKTDAAETSDTATSDEEVKTAA